MEQYQTSLSRKNSVRQQVECFSHSKNLRVAETWGKWKMYFTLISLSTHWGLKAHTLFHCLLSSGPEAHTFVWVIPQRPTPYFTVHSVGCLQPTSSFEWFLQRLHQSEGGFTVWGVEHHLSGCQIHCRGKHKIRLWDVCTHAEASKEHNSGKNHGTIGWPKVN